MRVAICGAGVIGAAIAYYLSRRGAEVIVLERRGVACAASSKAGGFLALDWCRGSALDPLARRSFLLHAALPKEIGADWGYRRVATYSGFAIGDGNGAVRRNAALNWVSHRVTVAGRIGSPRTTALVDPGAFTAAMMRAAQDRGAVLRLGQVTGVTRTTDASAVTGVDVAGETIAADAVVIAMGPWSVLAAAWLPLPPVFADKGHSVLFQTGSDIPAEAL
ncbi:MAG TPA: FAD-dependent oxidoreductase, partial [Acetobacteraceae bacterium]